MKHKLANVIQELSMQFAKFHYDKYLEDNQISYIPYENIENVVTQMFNVQKKKELADFIRTSLKKMCGDSYQNVLVEGIISEMFSDDDVVIVRVATEIDMHQRSK
jgi:hypothetical protein